MNLSLKAIAIGTLATLASIASVGVGTPSAASAYFAQDCGTNHFGTGSASAKIFHDTTSIAGCGMKATIKCKQGSTFDTTLYISPGNQTAAGQSRTVNCAAGWVRYYYGHQEGTNW